MSKKRTKKRWYGNDVEADYRKMVDDCSEIFFKFLQKRNEDEAGALSLLDDLYACLEGDIADKCQISWED